MTFRCLVISCSDFLMFVTSFCHICSICYCVQYYRKRFWVSKKKEIMHCSGEKIKTPQSREKGWLKYSQFLFLHIETNPLDKHCSHSSLPMWHSRVSGKFRAYNFWKTESFCPTTRTFFMRVFIRLFCLFSFSKYCHECTL